MLTRTCIIMFTGWLSFFAFSSKNSSRPESGVVHGAPWTDPRADLLGKRMFSIGNQKMTVENKVDR